MQLYDFILFENYHQASNHKIDVILIAKMLKKEKFNVAILNLYGEDNQKYIEGIPIINLPFQPKSPNDRWQLNPKNKVHSLFCCIRFLYQEHCYLRKVVKAIEPISNNFYCGSYHLGMSRQFFYINKPCFYWGLRSERMNNFFKHFIKNPIYGIRMLQLRKAFLSNPYQKLFVSNFIIKNEFKKIGVPADRIILREERCITKLGTTALSEQSKKIMFLVIGQLRKEKHVDTTIKSYKLANIPDSELKLIGKENPKYEPIISQNISGDSRIERIATYLSYNEFNKWFKQAHFVLFADEQGSSCITNGTMMEALINYRPIICPNHEPYTYYINKYNIGLLYETGNIKSYANTLKKAEKLGTKYFIPYISSFLKTITFDEVSKALANDIRKTISNSSI